MTRRISASKVLIDSSGWLDYFLNGPHAEQYAEYLKIPSNVFTPTIVLYEVYKKLRTVVGEEEAIFFCSQIQGTTITPLTDAIAFRAADFSLAYKLPMADSIIYATADTCGAQLITSDADFKDLSGVTYLSPAAPEERE